MQHRFLSLCGLLFVGCGGAAPKENATVPLVEIAHGDKTQVVNAGTNDVDEGIRPVQADVVESKDVCLERMRDGRGLPPDTMTSEAGQLYTEALAHERAAQLNGARKGYLLLIQRYPQSSLIPLVYFGFGELFFHEAQSDPSKFMLAEQSFREVMKYPAPENTAMSFTLIRLGELLEQSGKGPESLSILNKFMTLARTQPNAQCVQPLMDSGQKLMANVFADVGQPNRAFEFFMRSTGAGESDKTNAFDMLANLCDRYILRQKPQDAAVALGAAADDGASRGFCIREQHIIAEISPSIPGSTRDELARKHAARCERR